MWNFLDSYKHKGLRSKLVATLQSKGISNNKVLSAIARIPRHWFVEPAFAEWAYKDIAFPIDANQTISQPLTVAIQSSLLEIKKGDKVLEIGTGSGYQACVLNYLGAKVYTIERQEQLFRKTSEFLHEIGYSSVRTLFGDGYKGAPRFAPFDKIIITAGAIKIPEELVEQLAVGGIMVIPHGVGDEKNMLKIVKQADGSLVTEDHGIFKFVPFLEGTN